MLIIGLMSGTSVDGIDAALVEIEGEPPHLRCNLRAFQCIPWHPEVRALILDACRADTPAQSLILLNARLGMAFAAAAQMAAEAANVSLQEIDAIASHGQTVWHQPNEIETAGCWVRGTLQMGEPAIIAAETGCLVVSDFRAADMALGGQGAPLVPFADFALFASSDETRAVQNIGGIANVTYLPKNGTLADVIAFDTGPGNMLLDALTVRFTKGERQYDRAGAIAAQGKVSGELLQAFLLQGYFAISPPKSTGREMFGMEFAEGFLAEAQKLALPPEDTLATATALTAETIARAYKDFLPKRVIDTVIIGGGGAKNKTLMGMLAERLAPSRVTTHEECGIANDAKEAVAFALLAYETLHGRPSNVPSATGAKSPAILGKITLPPFGQGILRIRLDK